MDGQLVGLLKNGVFQLLSTARRGTVMADVDGTERLASPFGDRTVHPASAAALDYDLGTALKGGADAVGGGAVLLGASPPVVAGATAFASDMAVGEAIAPAVFGGSGKGVQMVTDCSPNCGQLQYRFGGIVGGLFKAAAWVGWTPWSGRPCPARRAGRVWKLHVHFNARMPTIRARVRPAMETASCCVFLVVEAEGTTPTIERGA